MSFSPRHRYHLTITALLLVITTTHSTTHPSLTETYYSKSCPNIHTIISQITTDKQITSPTTAPAALRLLFHDCLVTGCDASTLISSSTTPFHHPTERDADINLSLPGDGFDVITRAKAALELECPNTVSCTDILVIATRNLISLVGGPFYPVLLGRKDSFISNASLTEGRLPKPDMTVTELISIFSKLGFEPREMVALSGAHTIGFSHCKEFVPGAEFDPTYNPRLAKGLVKACEAYKQDPKLSVFNDIMTPNKFDNVYFKNLPKGLGILKSDRMLYMDDRTRPFVELYANDQEMFFKDFAKAIQKLSVVDVKVGNDGEIRRRCDAFNNS